MPRQANGTYVQPANTAAISGQSISSTAFNTLETDIGTEITNSVDRLGRSAMQAALPMGGNKVTGAADPTVSTDLATKNYVDTTTATFFSTGDVKLTYKTAPDTGWLMFDDGTFGNASSGSSNSNNVANLALFTLLFNSPFSDTYVPLFTAGGGATTRAAQVSASAAWAANCRMSLPKTLGRALGIAGAGSGLTARALGQPVGNETASLATTNLPPYTPNVTSGGVTLPVFGNTLINGGNNAGALAVSNNANSSLGTTTIGNPNIVVGAQGGTSTPFSIMQPSSFLNCMIKI